MKKKKIKITQSVPVMVLVFLLAVGIGAIGINVIKPAPVVEVKTDVLSLENGGEVVIKIIDNKKRVYISYEDLKYISKKKSKMKKLVSNLGALYERLAE